MKNPIPHLFFTLVIMILLSSCSLSSDKTKPINVIDSVNCIAPCWRGITPGVTTLDEAWALAQLLEQASDKKNFTPSVIRKNDENQYVYLDYNVPGVMLYSDSNGIIEEIVFIFQTPHRWKKPRLGDIISAYGKPESVEICQEIMETNGAIVYIYYPGIKLSFSHKLPINGDSFRVPIQENTRIDRITFIPESLEIPVYDFSFSWTGYGDVTVEPSKSNEKSICRELFP